MAKIRLTPNALRAISEMVAASPRELAGSDIAKATKLASGTLYPLLIRLEEAGYLESRWEDTDARDLGRPRRRYYRVTLEGERAARAVIAEMNASFGRLQWI